MWKTKEDNNKPQESLSEVSQLTTAFKVFP